MPTQRPSLLRWLPWVILALVGPLILAISWAVMRPSEVPPTLLTAHTNRVSHETGAAAPVVLPLEAPRTAQAGDRVRIDSSGRAIIRFQDTLIVEIFRQAVVTLGASGGAGPAPPFGIKIGVDPNAPPIDRFRLETGAVFNTLTPEQAVHQRLRIETEAAEMMATGTQFLVYHDARAQTSWIVVKEGTVRVANAFGSVTVGAQEQTWVVLGSAPQPPIPASRTLVGPRFPSIHEITNNTHDDCELLPRDRTVNRNPCPTLGTPTPTATATPSIGSPTRSVPGAATTTATQRPAGVTVTAIATRPQPVPQTPTPTPLPTRTPTVTPPPAPPPRIVALDPPQILAGQGRVLTITGTGFGRASRLLWNGVFIAATPESASLIRVVIPPDQQAAGQVVRLQVINPDQGAPIASNVVTFTINNPLPTISDFSWNRDATIMQVNGTDFVATSKVIVNGAERATRLIDRPNGPAFLQVEIAPRDITGPQCSVMVINPAPGGGESKSLRCPSIAWSWPDHLPAGLLDARLPAAGGESLTN